MTAMHTSLPKTRNQSNAFFVKLIHVCLLSFLSLFVSLPVLAQRTITGRVISGTDNLPLANVLISLKGTTVGTITDSTGSFNINAPTGSTLAFNYVGFTPKEVVMGETNNLSLTLGGAAGGLDEVVVIGYQSVR